MAGAAPPAPGAVSALWHVVDVATAAAALLGEGAAVISSPVELAEAQAAVRGAAPQDPTVDRIVRAGAQTATGEPRRVFSLLSTATSALLGNVGALAAERGAAPATAGG